MKKMNIENIEDANKEDVIQPDAGDKSDVEISDEEPPYFPVTSFDRPPFHAEELLTDMSQARRSQTLYRDSIIEQIMAILISRDKPNALLVGPAGCGKTNIVEELAYRITSTKAALPAHLEGYRIYAVNLSDIVSDSGLLGDLERKVRALVEYLEDPDNKAILFLDEIHMLFSGETYKKVAQMLKPALSRGKFKVIGATTTQEVKTIDGDPAFNRRFTRVLVDELTKEQTMCIVKKTIPVMQKHYGIKIRNTSGMSELIVNTADEFCTVGSHRPDNALTLLDRTIATQLVHNRSGVISLTRSMVENAAYQICSGNSKARRLNESKLRKDLSRIRGQNEITEDILRVLRLYDMHVRPRTRPLTFLFAGPSGVGKSEIARILAAEYIGEKPIVLNMTEYNSPASINRILGAVVGYSGYDSHSELPFDKLDSNPYQLILLDEFEKCDKSVQRLFMSVFEDGRMKTNSGKEIDFSKAIIIATTNAGFSRETKRIGFGGEKEEGVTVCDLTDSFDAELLNRFSHRYTFRSISRELYASIVRDTYEREIALLDCSRLNKDARKFFSAKPDERVIEMLVKKSYQPQFGARPARTVVADFIDTVLSGTVQNEKCVSVFDAQWLQAV